MCIMALFQNIVKKARTAKLIRLIRNNKKVNKIVGCLCALPLLPEDLIKRGYIWILNKSQKTGYFERLYSLLAYVWDTWICGEGEILSVYRCPFRTSNVCESDNAILNSMLKAKHPSIWALLGKSLNIISREDVISKTITINSKKFPLQVRSLRVKIMSSRM